MSLNAPKRIILLDVLRGFALFGMLWTHAGRGLIGGYRFLPNKNLLVNFGAPAIQQDLNFWADVLGTTFHNLFALLFGAGIYYSSISSRLPMHTKRLWWLVPFGIVHLAIWWGDVLLMYVLLGIPLAALFKKNLSNTILVAIFFVLLFLPDMRQQYIFYNPLRSTPSYGFDINAAITLTQTNGLDEAIVMNWKLIKWKWLNFHVATGRYEKISALFILGFIAARAGYFSKQKMRATYIAALFLVGVSVNYFYYLSRGVLLLPVFLGQICLMCAYVEIIRFFEKQLSFLVPYGRMPVTSYVSQSIIGVFLFYQIGFGLATQVRIWGYLAICALILVAQIIFSHFWIKCYPTGPLEQLWKRLYSSQICR